MITFKLLGMVCESPSSLIKVTQFFIKWTLNCQQLCQNSSCWTKFNSWKNKMQLIMKNVTFPRNNPHSAMKHHIVALNLTIFIFLLPQRLDMQVGSLSKSPHCKTLLIRLLHRISKILLDFTILAGEKIQISCWIHFTSVLSYGYQTRYSCYHSKENQAQKLNENNESLTERYEFKLGLLIFK